MKRASTLLIAAAACVPGVDLPIQNASTRSLILADSNPQCDTTSCANVIAYDGIAGRRFTLLPNTEVFLLEYDVELAALGLIEGPVPVCAGGLDCSGGERGLPAPDASSLLEIDTRSINRKDGGETPRLKLPQLDRRACLERGGCFNVADSEEALRCIVPCDAPEAPDVDAIQPPAPPNLRVDGRCPPGWSELEPNACTPPPACPSGQVRKSRGEPCTPIGSPCPAGDFADDAQGVFVKPNAINGDGSRERPFGSLREALAIASTTTIALSKGTFTTDRCEDIPRPLIGACVEQTIIEMGGTCRELTVANAPAVLRNFQLHGALVSRFGHRIDLRGLLIEGTGLAVSTGTISGSELVLRGGGLSAFGSEVSLRGVHVEGAAGAAFDADGGSRVRLESISVDASGEGLRIRENSSVEVAGGSFRGIMREGAAITRQESRMILRETSFTAISGTPVKIDATGAQAELYDTVIDGGSFKVGFDLVRGTALIERLRMSGTPEVAMRSGSFQIDTALTARDVLLEIQPVPMIGAGIEAFGTDTFERLAISGTRITGFSAYGTVTISDVRIEDNGPPEVPASQGLYADFMGVLDASRVVISRAGVYGVRGLRASLNLRDLIIEDCTRGIDATDSTVELSNVATRNLRGDAISFCGVFAPSLSNVNIAGVVSSLERRPSFALYSSNATLDGFAITDGDIAFRLSDACTTIFGEQRLDDSKLTASNGRVRGNAAGLELIGQSIDLRELMSRVRFETEGDRRIIGP